MPTEAHSYTDAELHRFANQVKEVLFATLCNEGVLPFGTTDDFERFCAEYVVVVSRPKVFGRFWDKIFKTENGSVVTVLKSILPASDTKIPTLKLIKDD
jgi:hypothetical protein